MPRSICFAGIVVWRPKISAVRLSCLGSRCWMITKAAPISADALSKNDLSAPSPPAEAPSPTIGQFVTIFVRLTFPRPPLEQSMIIACFDLPPERGIELIQTNAPINLGNSGGPLILRSFADKFADCHAEHHHRPPGNQYAYSCEYPQRPKRRRGELYPEH